MRNNDIFTFKRHIIEELVCVHNMSEIDAEKAFKNSVIYKMLKKSPDFIMHYSIEDNAEEIYNEYMGIPMEM